MTSLHHDFRTDFSGALFLFNWICLFCWPGGYWLGNKRNSSSVQSTHEDRYDTEVQAISFGCYISSGCCVSRLCNIQNLWPVPPYKHAQIRFFKLCLQNNLYCHAKTHYTRKGKQLQSGDVSSCMRVAAICKDWL